MMTWTVRGVMRNPEIINIRVRTSNIYSQTQMCRNKMATLSVWVMPKREIINISDGSLNIHSPSRTNTSLRLMSVVTVAALMSDRGAMPRRRPEIINIRTNRTLNVYYSRRRKECIPGNRIMMIIFQDIMPRHEIIELMLTYSHPLADVAVGPLACHDT
jgi:hypothetical protein